MAPPIIAPTKAKMNEALLLQQDGWEYIRHGQKYYVSKGRAIFTIEEVRKGLDRWVRAATNKPWN